VRGISVYQNSNEWQESAFPKHSQKFVKKFREKFHEFLGMFREKFPDKTEEFL
jgi:hypothetical protein